MDNDRPVIVSNEYRSGFLLRVKKTNGKVGNIWLEISDHNESLSTTLKSLSDVVEQLKLKEEVGINPLKPTNPPNPPQQPEKLNVRYFCSKCGYSFPAFPSSPIHMSYFCPTCNKWGSFNKK